MILGTLAASLLGNMSVGKGVVIDADKVIHGEEGAIAASRGQATNRGRQDFKYCLIL